MKELYRVLKTGGWAILQSPVDQKRATTYEDKNVTKPEDRRREFGQEDHVRIYGLDYAARLEKAGFRITVDLFIQSLSPELVKANGLVRDEYIYVGTKAPA